jgi:PAS domain S-box-containing protein
MNPMSYRTTLRQILALPPVTSPRERQTLALTAGILYAILLISVFQLLVTLLLQQSGQMATYALISLGLLIGITGILLLKRGQVRAAAWIVTCLIWFTVAGMSVLFGGVTTAGYTYFGLAILVAMLVLQRKSAIIVSGLILLTAIGVFALDISGALQEPAFTRIDSFSVLLGQFVLIFFIVFVTSRTFDLSLSEIHTNEQRLAQAERRFRSMVEHSHDGILLIDYELVVSYMTPSVQRILGYTEKDLIGVRDLKLVYPDDVAYVTEVFMEISKHPAETVKASFRALHKDGSWRWVDVLATNMMDDPGISAVVVNLRDATERVELEASRLKYEVMQAEIRKEQELVALKERFISTVSHEFRTPLAVITSSGEILRLYGDRIDETKRQERVSQILNSALGMKTLMDQVLTLNRLQHARDRFSPSPQDVVRLCHNLVEQARVGRGTARTIAFVHDDIGLVPVDDRLLQHILLNLLTNALKYSPDDSVVTLRVRSVAAELVIDVEDHGMGIPPEDQARLFEPFHRAANASQIEGTGLGLAIVRENVELHGGTISFVSTMGVGTTFTVRLPLATS